MIHSRYCLHFHNLSASAAIYFFLPPGCAVCCPDNFGIAGNVGMTFFCWVSRSRLVCLSIPPLTATVTLTGAALTITLTAIVTLTVTALTITLTAIVTLTGAALTITLTVALIATRIAAIVRTGILSIRLLTRTTTCTHAISPRMPKG